MIARSVISYAKNSTLRTRVDIRVPFPAARPPGNRCSPDRAVTRGRTRHRATLDATLDRRAKLPRRASLHAFIRPFRRRGTRVALI